MLHGQFFGAGEVAPGVLARSVVGTLVRRIPEDVSILNKLWHAGVSKQAKKQGGEWVEFEAVGKDALERMK